METIESASTKLMNLVRMLGPESKDPPYVRLAFPPLALPRVLRQFCGEAEREQRELLEEVRAHGGVITPREMGRMHRRWMDPVAAEMALRRLCSAGAGYLPVDPPGPTGGRPSLKFRLGPPPPEDRQTPAN